MFTRVDVDRERTPTTVTSDPQCGIAAAAAEALVKRRALEARAASCARLHHALTCVDEVLLFLGNRNLDGITGVDREVRERLRALEARVGLPLPSRLARARTNLRAHALLLDWQEDLIAELAAPGSQRRCMSENARPTSEELEAETDPDTPRHGEDPDSPYVEDAVHWIRVYTELIALKEELLHRFENMESGMSDDPVAAAGVDRRILSSQADRYRHRRAYWVGRAHELAATVIQQC